MPAFDVRSLKLLDRDNNATQHPPGSATHVAHLILPELQAFSRAAMHRLLQSGPDTRTSLEPRTRRRHACDNLIKRLVTRFVPTGQGGRLNRQALFPAVLYEA